MKNNNLYSLKNNTNTVILTVFTILVFHFLILSSIINIWDKVKKGSITKEYYNQNLINKINLDEKITNLETFNNNISTSSKLDLLNSIVLSTSKNIEIKDISSDTKCEIEVSSKELNLEDINKILELNYELKLIDVFYSSDNVKFNLACLKN